MPYHIRPLNTAIDFPRIVELVNSVNPEPVSEEAFRARQEQEGPGRVSYTVVVVDEAGVIGGYVSLVRNPWIEVIPLHVEWLPAEPNRAFGERERPSLPSSLRGWALTGWTSFGTRR